MHAYLPRSKNVEDDHPAIKRRPVQGVQNELPSREPSIAVVVESIYKLIPHKGRGFEEELVDVRRRGLDIPSWVQPSYPRGYVCFTPVCWSQ